MKDNSRGNNKNETPDESLSGSAKNESPKKRDKSKQQTDQPNNSKAKQKSFWKSFARGWKASGPTRKIEIIFLGIAAVAGLAYTISYIIKSLYEVKIVHIEHSPNVIHSRPPEFLQPFVCDPRAGFHSGNMRLFAKNVGTAKATDVVILPGQLKVVPERKRGDKFIDDIPLGDCGMKLKPSGISAPLAIGQERSLEIRQMAMNLPQLSADESVQLYQSECVYYSDEFGGSHATCDTYRLAFQTTDPIDAINGTPTFHCDAVPKIGKFQETLQGHCGN